MFQKLTLETLWIHLRNGGKKFRIFRFSALNCLEFTLNELE